MHKRIIQNSFFLLADRGFRLVISFVLGILIARFYGPEEFGQLNYVLATASVFGSLSSLGLDDIVPRDMAALNQQGLSRDDIEKTAFILRLLGGTAAYVLVLGLMFYETGASRLFLIACLLALYLPIQAGDIYEYRLRVEDEFSKIAISRSLAAFLANVLKALVLIFALPISYIAVAMTSEFIITFQSFKYFLGKKKYSQGVFSFDYAKSLLKRSWKIMLAGLLMMCQARVEYFLVEKFLGWQDLGQYSAALKIFEIIDVACIVLVTVLMPKLASMINEKNTQIYRRRAYLAGLLIYLMLVPGMMILTILFPYAYGAQYAGAAMILPWLFLRPFFGMLNSIRAMFIVLDGNFWSSSFSALLGLCASLIVGYQLIPAYGLLGAVATTLIGLFCLTIIADILFNRKNIIALLTCFYELRYFMDIAKKR